MKYKAILEKELQRRILSLGVITAMLIKSVRILGPYGTLIVEKTVKTDLM